MDAVAHIIAICGASGVGTTAAAFAFQRVTPGGIIFGTDKQREALREASRRPPQRYSALEAHVLALSSFEAWRPAREPHAGTGYSERPSEREILKGFYHQSELILVHTVGAVKRALIEGHTMILEGVHLPLDRLRLRETWNVSEIEWEHLRRRIFTVLIDCDADTHRQHLIARANSGEGSTPNRYLTPQSWRSITTIRHELARVGTPNAHLILDAREPMPTKVDRFAERFYQWKTHGGI